jgi:hypothetical protein
MNRGGPDTDLKALTGELTPPGKYFFASSNKAADFSLLINWSVNDISVLNGFVQN